MIKTVGIDLGTTNTVAAQMKKGEPREIHNQRGEYITPSAVALTKKGELLVGEDARKRGSGIVMSFKRDMGTDKKMQFNKRDYTPLEMSATVLRRVKRDVRTALGEPVSRAVITVPAWFSERAIVETREAGILAGFFVLRTFSEPMAAALAYGIDREDTEPKTILVYDLGGGTFDISVLMVAPGSFAALDHEGDVYLGGDDFDLMIMEHIRQRLQKERGLNIPDDSETRHAVKLACEHAKIDLSSMEITEVHLGALGREGVDIDIELSRQEFEPLIMPWLVGPRRDGRKSTMEHVRQAIAKSDLTPDTIDNILLVGGSTYIPLVSQILSREFGEEKILRVVNPMLCVAHGAAIETALVHEVDCLQCHHKNQLDAIKCEKCSASLVGEEKIDCPVCFLPSPAAAKNCWKCGSELRTVPHPAPDLSKKCPQGHENSLTATLCSKCGYAFEGGGIKCVKCGNIINAGKTKCGSCGADIPTRTEVTPKDIGIKLIDGQFSVIVPKNTPYPTESPLHKLHRTPQANVQQLQIEVHEGESKIAKENEWLGELVLELPNGLPENTPVDISIELDADSSMWVAAKLVDQPLTAVSARIDREPGGAEGLLKAEALLKKSRLIAEQVGEDKEKQLPALITEIEEAIRKKDTRLIGSRLAEWEKRLADYEGEANAVKQIANRISWAEFTLGVAAEYIDNEKRKKIESLIGEVKKARDSGNLTAAQEKCKRLEDTLESMGNINIIVYAEAAARNPDVSPATSSQLYKGLGELKAVLSAGNTRAITQKLDELYQLVVQASREVEAAGGTTIGPLPPK